MAEMRGGVQAFDRLGRVKSEATRLGSKEMVAWINSWTQEVRVFMTASGEVTVSVRKYPGGDLIDAWYFKPDQEAD